MKDIEQRDLALLASSSGSLESLVRPDPFLPGMGPFGVFTSFVIEALIELPVSVQDVYEHAAAGMQEFFRRLPDLEPREPFLWSDLSATVYLKP